MTHFEDLDKLILPSNSCPIDLTEKSRGGIRIRMDQQSFDIEVRHANDDVTYRPCNKQHLIESFRPYFGLVASNKQAYNEIDINAIYVKNRDPRVYKDKEKLEEERLSLLVERH